MYTVKDCLYSTVKNISGSTLRFGFLPPHGVQLANNEEYSLFGDVRNRLQDARAREAFARAIDNGLITITHTPSPILKDTATEVTKMLARTSGSLVTVDPCWAASDTEHEDVAP